MPPDEHSAQAGTCEPADAAIRKNLHELLRLLAREVARRLSQRTENRAARDQRSSKEHPSSA